MATGTVTEWDDHGGYGTITDDDSGASHFFHCTQLLDGSRTTSVGEKVSFDVVAGPPFDRFAHRVDQAVDRDVIVARRPAA